MRRRQKSLPRVSSGRPSASEAPPVGDSRQGGDGPQTLPSHGVPPLSEAVRPPRVDQLVPADPRMRGWRLYDPARAVAPAAKPTLLTNGCRCRAADVVDDDWLEPEPSPAEELAAARADAAAQIEAVRAEIAERDAQRRRAMDERIAQMRAAQAPPPATAWE